MKIFTWRLKRSTSPIKIDLSLCGFPSIRYLQNPPQRLCSSKSYEYDNYDKKIRSFPLLLDPPGKIDHQAIHCPTANFGPLSRCSVTNAILITVFDNYLTPRSPGAWI